ncbi:DNA alkylation response protein [Paracoccus kondratievae]|uniref:Acyl-CoA dehydrogenase n=1 Tax=Paracoccus kondratievae TaxID=135740 RepID=A0AAD3NVP7_9RHOB|nr:MULTISPECIES: acyl-CoA dehydrogenase family protein [Paracoccus]QFQ86138.1 DNA alkylation response protein [Paracoccus kondratievae]GLK62892.1 acyl-CoA dehydrogenase [Paracoccus kondratievae]SMG51332.1 Acyl-CoA dehydrogenase [Paracoccus sp. J56]
MSAEIYRNIPDSVGMNVFSADPAMADLLRIYLPSDILPTVLREADRMGHLVGGWLEELALVADKNPPVLHIRARNGAPVERIEKHPAYEALEDVAFGEFGLAAMSHRPGVFGLDTKLPPLVKYALVYLFVQAEFGLCCPLSMTDSLTRTLVKFGSQDLIDRYFDQLTSQDMDELFQGAMFMTEQIAGSDVGAIDTIARQENGEWKLYGDKWFCSNPDAALAMVLARPEGGEGGTRGLTLFLLPRILPDGRKNDYRILRLKDKMGTRSMASGEIALEGATAYIVGDPGRGFKHMTDMINNSRLANGVRSAGLMRRAVNEAVFIATNRTAFGKRLIDLPLMRRQLSKMLLTAEQGRSMVFHTARVLDAADRGAENMAKVLRIMTPLVKFRTCRDARKVTGDGMEVRGGCGYIEEWSDARVLRDAHLGSIWEGTSNIVALDVARAVRREDALTALESYLTGLNEETQSILGPQPAITDAFKRSADLLHAVAHDPAREIETRQAASAVYNATSSVVMAWESARQSEMTNERSTDRLTLAHGVLRHKLSSRDPLDTVQGAADDELISLVYTTLGDAEIAEAAE